MIHNLPWFVFRSKMFSGGGGGGGRPRAPHPFVLQNCVNVNDLGAPLIHILRICVAGPMWCKSLGTYLGKSPEYNYSTTVGYYKAILNYFYQWQKGI